MLILMKDREKASSSRCNEEFDWNIVWNVDVPPKVKNFAWRAVSNGVATRVNLCSRGMQIDNVCAMCGEKKEDILHLLVFCNDSKFAWRLSPLRLDVESFEGSNFSLWCASVRSKHKDVQWWSIFWCIIWGLWLRRNAWVYEGKRKDIGELLQKAVNLVGEYEQVIEASSTCVKPLQHPKLWSAPSIGVIKVNSDAAIFSNKSVGFGAVLRDHVGDVVASSCHQVKGGFEAEIAEAMAMRHALNIALQLGFNNLCLETDCLSLYNSLVRSVANPTAFGLVVHDILQLSYSCVSCSFSFVKREGNKVAHSLASLSCSYEEMMVWMEDIPGALLELVKADFSPSFA